jgi:sugar lactone lactonase YvrE/enterochelin esterase-like enzyme
MTRRSFPVALRGLLALLLVVQTASPVLAQAAGARGTKRESAAKPGKRRPPVESYPVHEDSKVQPGVPQGTVHGPIRWTSKIFSGTVRDYWIYEPPGYDKSKPHCQIVVQDGMGVGRRWKIPTVLDNLIHKKSIPPMIGIFISPGVVMPARKDAQPRFNRSFEYDGMGPRYALFLEKEILPEVARRFNLSDDPNDRMITGSSSGAICAFTAAWERPDLFRRVFTAVGTFVSLKGGNEYPALVRKFEPRPIRVFLQDGRNDLDIYGGSWWEANQQMLASLKWAGYDVKHAWGHGGHNSKHATAILPDVMTWLWRDYPRPITNVAGTPRRSKIILPSEGWQEVSSGHRFTEGPAVSDSGEVYFTDIPNNRIHKIGLDGTVSLFASNTGAANGLMFGPDGKLYACQNGNKRIVRYDARGQAETVVDDVTCNDLVILGDHGYFTDPPNKQVWHFTLAGKKQVVAKNIAFPNGVVATTDHAFLLVTDTRGRFNLSFAIQPDGSLAHRQQHGHLHRGDGDNDTGADGLAVDTAGRSYVTTRMGVQVLDQLGRVHIILSKPGPGWLSNVVFGGPKLDTLYVTCGTRVYRRKVATRGVRPWKGPAKPPRPQL